MKRDKDKLSDYIDSLNEEKKPKTHESFNESLEMEKLMDTVRKVRSLKEPVFPEGDFSKKIGENVTEQLWEKRSVKKKKRIWVAAAAVVVLALLLSFALYPQNTDIVHAMEQAFKEIKAYHGIIEIIEKNAEGKETVQAVREVWADKKGRYYVKEMEGAEAILVTANNGEKKWQLRFDEEQAFIFPSFPDPYQFTFELGNEIDRIKDASEVRTIGEDSVSKRPAIVLEVTPKGGESYRIWVDKETRLPLKRESAMVNSIQYISIYTSIDYHDALPEELITYNIPNGFEKIDKNPEQLINNIEEAEGMVGFTIKMPKEILKGYKRESISILEGGKTAKLSYTSQDKKNKVIVLQGIGEGELNPASNAILGEINGGVAEIQSPVREEYGILSGGGIYSGITDITSVHWREDGFEFAVIGNLSLEDLMLFVENLWDGMVVVLPKDNEFLDKPQIQVPVDLNLEENEQKSVDGGHSPWKLDPVYVAQVFVSLEIFPEGIVGEYPVKYED
ncbi:MAG TPA: hypothetical protein GX727_02085, partial [Clostridium sp.]|nr:hypothetical protein [Clostridium sp.]